VKCLRDDCACACHVDPATHVPCCPGCRLPLIATSTPFPGHGACPNGMYCRERGRSFPPDLWLWLHRDMFDPRDLPPANGWKPVPIPDDLTEGR
jgi:hypothetical protein